MRAGVHAEGRERTKNAGQHIPLESLIKRRSLGKHQREIEFQVSRDARERKTLTIAARTLRRRPRPAFEVMNFPWEKNTNHPRTPPPLPPPVQAAPRTNRDPACAKNTQKRAKSAARLENRKAGLRLVVRTARASAQSGTLRFLLRAQTHVQAPAPHPLASRSCGTRCKQRAARRRRRRRRFAPWRAAQTPRCCRRGPLLLRTAGSASGPRRNRGKSKEKVKRK